jgi:hypothetical protein
LSEAKYLFDFPERCFTSFSMTWVFSVSRNARQLS